MRILILFFLLSLKDLDLTDFTFEFIETPFYSVDLNIEHDR